MHKGLAFIIFGATGDLTYRKLLPALQLMEEKGQLGPDFKIIAIGRRPYDSEQYRNTLPQTTLPLRFLQRIEYLHMDLEDALAYVDLQERLLEVAPLQRWVFYLALSPDLFFQVCQGFQACKLCAHEHRVIIEKPFGTDIENVKAINATLENTFGAENIYRIDHYLGKEMIQSILSLRFGNTFLQTLWNQEGIERIEIDALETLGVQTRGAYYDHHGALKDMIQNHLFQLVTLLLMEEPARMEDIHLHQEEVLTWFRPLAVERDLVLGQYEQYRSEANVAPDSKTETFVSMQLRIDHPKYATIPITLTTGKMLSEKRTECRIYFRQKQNGLFPNAPQPVLTIMIYPDEGIDFAFNVKEIGGNALHAVGLHYCQSCVLENRLLTLEAYERLLAEAFLGNKTLFATYGFVEKSWTYIEALKRQLGVVPLHHYGSGMDMLAFAQAYFAKQTAS
ncbi:MAG: glucose-6-phosphate dehydrogenase [Erysipelotrichaceae bacterium]